MTTSQDRNVQARIPEELHYRLRMRVAKDNSTIKAIVTHGIERLLDEMDAADRAAEQKAESGAAAPGEARSEDIM